MSVSCELEYTRTSYWLNWSKPCLYYWGVLKNWWHMSDDISCNLIKWIRRCCSLLSIIWCVPKGLDAITEQGPNSSGHCVHVQRTFFLNTNWRAGGRHGNNGSQLDVVPALGIWFTQKIAPSHTLSAEGSLRRQSNWSKRPENSSAKTSVEIGAPQERALPLKINFYAIGQSGCKFFRLRKASEFLPGGGVNRTGRRAKSVVIIVMDVVNSLLVEINGAGVSSALLDRSCRRRRRRPAENRATGFIALYFGPVWLNTSLWALRKLHNSQTIRVARICFDAFCFEHADAHTWQ